jgi:hypothetical protein
MKTFVRYLWLAVATMALGAREARAEESNASAMQPDPPGQQPGSAASSSAPPQVADKTSAPPQDANKTGAPPQDASKASQPPQEANKTLLSGKLDNGGYGAPIVKVTSLAGQAGILVGGRGAWVIGHSFTLGGAGYGLPTSVEVPEAARGSVTKTALALGYGGFQVGYIFLPREIVHFSSALLIGGGGVAVIDRSQGDWQMMHSAAVFVLEPEVGVEVNITPLIRGGIHASYRYMSDSTIPGLSSGALSGPSAGAMLAFGAF